MKLTKRPGILAEKRVPFYTKTSLTFSRSRFDKKVTHTLPIIMGRPKKERKESDIVTEFKQENSIDFNINAENPQKLKKKLAPRSSLQFKVGPSFCQTTISNPIFLSSSHEIIYPVVEARVDRGFDKEGEDWVGYKRNYFTLVACFHFGTAHEPDIVAQENFYIIVNGKPKTIQSFNLRLVSRCYEDNTNVSLVQHTAKRDRGPQISPPIFPSVPGALPNHSIIKEVANIRNGSKINHFDKFFYMDRKHDYKNAATNSVLSTYPSGERIAKVAKYERIQFSSTDSQKRTTMSSKHCILEVQLLGQLEGGSYEVLGSIETPPLVVRGRSPSNYQIKKAMLSKAKNKPLAVNQNFLNHPQPTDPDPIMFKHQYEAMPKLYRLMAVPSFSLRPEIYDDIIPMKKNEFGDYNNSNFPQLQDSDIGGVFSVDKENYEPEPSVLSNLFSESAALLPPDYLASISPEIASLSKKSQSSRHKHRSKSKHRNSSSKKTRPISKHRHHHRHYSHRHHHKLQSKSRSKETLDSDDSFLAFQNDMLQIQTEIS